MKTLFALFVFPVVALPLPALANRWSCSIPMPAEQRSLVFVLQPGQATQVVEVRAGAGRSWTMASPLQVVRSRENQTFIGFFDDVYSDGARFRFVIPVRGPARGRETVSLNLPEIGVRVENVALNCTAYQ